MPLSSGGRGRSGGCCPSNSTHPESCTCEECSTNQENRQEVVKGGIARPISSDCKKKKEKVVVEPPKVPSIMDVMRETKDCHCGIIARALADDLHSNLGLQNTRHLINGEYRYGLSTLHKTDDKKTSEEQKTSK